MKEFRLNTVESFLIHIALASVNPIKEDDNASLSEKFRPQKRNDAAGSQRGSNAYYGQSCKVHREEFVQHLFQGQQ